MAILKQYKVFSVGMCRYFVSPQESVWCIHHLPKGSGTPKELKTKNIFCGSFRNYRDIGMHFYTLVHCKSSCPEELKSSMGVVAHLAP